VTVSVFDIDGTLIGGKSTERRFVGWLLRRGYVGPRQLLAAGWYCLRWLPVHGRQVFRKNKAYLSGLSEAAIRREAREFVSQLGDDVYIPSAVVELRTHLKLGNTVVLLSGSLQAIVDALAERLGAHIAIGTLCETNDGRFRARPPLRHPFHTAKCDCLQMLCKSEAIAVDEVVAYGDSSYDIPLLSMVGKPMAIRPDPQLRALSRQNGWRILEAGQNAVSVTQAWL